MCIITYYCVSYIRYRFSKQILRILLTVSFIITQCKYVTALANENTTKTALISTRRQSNATDNKPSTSTINYAKSHQTDIPKPIVSMKFIDQYDDDFLLQHLSGHTTILRKLNFTKASDNGTTHINRGKSMREAVRIAAEQSFVAMKKLYDETEPNLIKKGKSYFFITIFSSTLPYVIIALYNKYEWEMKICTAAINRHSEKGRNFFLTNFHYRKL